MHILFLVNNYPPGGQIGGIVSYTVTMARAWRDTGHRVSVVCQSDTGERVQESDGGIEITRVVPQKYPGAWKDKVSAKLSSDNSQRALFHKEFSYAAYKDVESWKDQPDVIESPEAFGWSWAFVKHSKIPVAVRVHGPNALATAVNAQLAAKAVDDLETSCLKRASLVTTPTHYMKNVVEAWGVTVNEVVPLPFRGERAEGVNRKASQILTVGRLTEGKGVDTAIRVLLKLSDEWKVVIAGPGDYREALESLAKDLGVSERVVFKGQVSSEEVSRLMADSSCVLHDSKNDNMPLVLLEALAQGTPVLASRIGGIPETVSALGTLISQGDVDAYAEAIKTLKPLDVEEVTSHLASFEPHEVQAQLQKLYEIMMEGTR